MWRRMFFLTCLVSLLVLANSASAVHLWIGEGDGTSWYDGDNWDPCVPTKNDPVDMNSFSPVRGPIIDGDVECGRVHHAYTTEENDDASTNIDVVSGNWKINGEWRWCEDGKARSTVTISGGNVTVVGEFRWADTTDTYGILNVSGGRITTPRIKIGDNGGGQMNITNGGSVIVTGSEFDIKGSKPVTVTVDDGLLKVIPKFVPRGKTTINLDSGTIEAGLFDPDGTAWVMDINDGTFIVDGNDVNSIKNEYIKDGLITAYDEAVGSEVHVDYNEVSNKTIVWATTIYTWARNPEPENRAEDLCPEGVVLSWTPGVLTAPTDGHDVYFGTNYGDVGSATTSTPDIYKGRQTENTYDASTLEGPLLAGTTYYWRIDQVDKDDPGVIYKGKKVWEFTINDGNAFDPSPGDNEVRVEPDSKLEWSAGCWASSHKVFFGTSYAEVEGMTDPCAIKGLGEEVYDPCTLELKTEYYWRIDEVNDSTMQTWKGKVWKFRTRSKIIDLNMHVWYEFEEESGVSASDSSGYENHGTITGAGAGDWEPNDGYFGGALRFPSGDDQYNMSVDSAALDTISSAVTVAVWLNLDEDIESGDDEAVFDAGDLGEEGTYKMTARIPDGTGTVTWRAGNDKEDVLVWKDADAVSWIEEWHHFAFLKDEDAGVMKIYFDGFVADSNNVVATTISNVKGKSFALGSYNHQNAGWIGLVDDFKVYDKALTDKEVQALVRGGDLGKAWRPDPSEGARDVPRDANLAWLPGDYVEWHKVFFGTDWDDVNDMVDPCATRLLGDEKYDPGLFELGETYYWRVDEMNDSDPNVWKGKVWSFTAADYLLVEDFESYGVMSSPVYDTWLSGTRFVPYPPWYIYVNGSITSLAASYAQPPDPVHRGKQALIFDYLNDGLQGKVPYYSETECGFDPPHDWTEAGVKVLTLFFYGDPNNDANETEQMYVTVRSGDVNGTVRYGYYPDEDMNDIREDEWQEWNIALSDFAGVDMNSVARVYIGSGDANSPDPGGVGRVLFDDIRLYQRKCIAERRTAGFALYDFSKNCEVDFEDVEIMAEDWLETDEFVTAAAPNSPEARYEFSQNLNDTSGSNHHGTLIPETATAIWEAGGKYGYCIDFNETYGVEIPGAVFADANERVTISLWVNGYTDQNAVTNVILQAGEGTPPYVGDWNDIIRIETEWSDAELTFEAGGDSVDYEDFPDKVWAGEWNHYGFVADVNKDSLKIYRNGRLVEDADAGKNLTGINHAFIGIAPETDEEEGGWHDEYIGKLDDFRVYDYALTKKEIAYLVLGGPGTLYLPVESVSNLYDGETVGSKVVNLRDMAAFAQKWLLKEYWPQ